MKVSKFMAVAILMCLCIQSMQAQQIGFKTNALYWATTTPNMGMEMEVGKKHTAQVFFGLNPWKQSSGDHSSLRHWMVMPEYRYWFNQNFDGWFLGAHALGGQYNVGGVKFPFGLLKGLRNHRYEGWYAGGGITAGNNGIFLSTGTSRLRSDWAISIPNTINSNVVLVVKTQICP